MPGLLGDSWDDPRSAAVMALAGGLLNRNMGAGLLGANAAYGNAKIDAMKQKLVDAQMRNYDSEIEARKLKTVQEQRQQSMIEGMFPGLLGGSPQPAATPGVPAASGMPAGPSGQPGQPQGGGQNILSLSQQLGIPPEAIKTDMLFNGGKGIADMLYKRGVPDMQVSNGYAFDKNRQSAGYLPQLNASQDGKTSMIQIGPDGMPVVAAPRGAVDTYSQFRTADEAAKAGQDLVKVTGPDGAERYVTRSQAVQATQPQPMQQPGQPPMQQARPQPGMTGSFTGSPEQVAAGIAAIRDPQERANAQAAFDEQARRTPQFSQGGPFQASQTTAQATDAAAGKEMAVQTAKDVAEQRKGIMNAGFVAPSNIAKYQQIGKLLADVDGGKFTAAGTELASALNGFGIKIDKNLPNKQAAASFANEAALQLRSPAGGAGMPGAMSDQDRVFLASMTPNMTQSAQGRKMVIEAYVAVQQRNQQVAQFARKYEQKHGKLDNGFFDQMQAWSTANPLFKAQ